MGELTIKLDDVRLLEALTEMASVHRHPIEAEVLGLLEKAVQEHARGLGHSAARARNQRHDI